MSVLATPLVIILMMLRPSFDHLGLVCEAIQWFIIMQVGLACLITFGFSVNHRMFQSVGGLGSICTTICITVFIV